ncbi:unnamed protein product [Oikopleura dioica]|uniref:Uncharacterized protein n=1 Tax=Oikopleura dioica TaxID=34765 RepID=E4XCE6_OIKDI|nr:unnamed protein product [Oikopleura dioica]
MSYVILSVDELPKPVIPLKPIGSDDSDKGDKTSDNQNENVAKEEDDQEKNYALQIQQLREERPSQSINPPFYPKILDLRAAGVELSDEDMFDSDDEAPQAGPMVEDDPEGVDFIDSDDESNMLAKQMQFTPADSTIAFEL